MGTGADVAGEQRLDHHSQQPQYYHQTASDGASGGGGDLNNHHGGSSSDREQRDDKTLSIMSPFDEQEEWAKISEIMASFGTGLVRESVFVTELEKEFQTRLGLSTDTGSPCAVTLVGQWLSKLNLADYESLFTNYGYDDLEFINGVLDESDLKDMGITSEQERAVILDAASLLNNRVEKRPATIHQSVDEWLKSIHLENYAELFRRHLYTDMERVRRVWEVELAAVLEIQKPAHRKRILASVSGGCPSHSTATMTSKHVRNGNGPNLEDLNKDLNTLKTNIQQLKDEIREKLPDVHDNGLPAPTTSAPSATTTLTTNSGSVTVTGTNASTTGTLKARKNRPAPPPPQPKPSSAHNGAVQASEHLEIRGPSELLFGVPATLKTQWRHQPKDLVTGCVTYVANYLGSTVVKELRGTESTKKSIQKLKKINRDPRGTPDITLSISYRGVRFLNTLTDEPICEHEIRNIHCACQDADDLTHFAYITKDHASRTHFCHVFCVPTMDQATEIILTLGQAFEVAYQIALKDKLGNHHAIRSQSANQLTSLGSSAPNSAAPTKVANSLSRETSQNDHHRNSESTSNHQTQSYSTNTAPRTKPRSKSITNPFTNTSLSAQQQQQNIGRISSPSKSSTNANSHSNANSNSTCNSNSSMKTGSGTTNPVTVKLLATHGRSHSVNDIKINGNQLKLAPAPVDDISIGGVKDMKAGSRAPIALSEEL